jgi:single-strand DNA-binding protein
MASFNKAIVMGTLGRDPQVRYTTGGTAVCEISLACNRTWKDKSGNKQEACDWIDCVLWGRQAEVCGEYCRKGGSLLIEGRLEISKWEKDGVKHQRMKVVVESMTLLGSRRDSSDQTPASYSGEESQASHNGFDGTGAVDPTGDVPF